MERCCVLCSAAAEQQSDAVFRSKDLPPAHWVWPYEGERLEVEAEVLAERRLLLLTVVRCPSVQAEVFPSAGCRPPQMK